MSNIVYVLTNPAMPGIVKIGMTDRPEVQRRMGDLYTTGVPLPFECFIAWQIEDRAAAEIERALHMAFGPNRVNPSREFFELDPEQVEALLRVMPGRDVTPQVVKESTEIPAEDKEASSVFKRLQSQTNESKFLQLLSPNGKVVYERVLALGKQEGMRINWGSKGFSLNAVSGGVLVPLCYGYPPSAFNQRIYTGFGTFERRSNVPQEVVEKLRGGALETQLFVPVGKGENLACETDRNWDEMKLAALLGWLGTVLDRIREYETSDPDR